MNEGVNLLTCTGDRPAAFELCARYVDRQDYDGPIHWIIVDDGHDGVRMPLRVKSCSSYEVIRLDPMDGNSFARNMLRGLRAGLYDKWVIIEDDDAYAPHHVSWMMEHLDNHELVGQRESRYYHVSLPGHYTKDRISYSSMCRTAFQSSVIPMLKGLLEEKWEFADMRLWSSFLGEKVMLGGSSTCISIKGMPGREGAGALHNNTSAFQRDDDHSVFREWLRDDAGLYGTFLGYRAAGR